MTLEWLPVYFGILRAGAWAVPLNFRFVASTICKCTQTAEAKAFIFGEEFVDRVKEIKVDGEAVEGLVVPGFEDGEHKVAVVMG